MKAGFARTCVTPELGTPQQGLWQKSKKGCTAIREDLYVQVLALSDDNKKFLIVGSDLLFFDRPTADRFKEALGACANIAPEQVFLNASHNHAGPPTSTWGYQQKPDSTYMNTVQAAMTDAAGCAMEALEEVTLSAGMTESDLPVSRRKLTPDGRAEFLPAPDGEICPAVPVCLLTARDGRVVSLLYSASCHPSAWYEPEISGDWPGVSNRLLNEHFNTFYCFRYCL